MHYVELVKRLREQEESAARIAELEAALAGCAVESAWDERDSMSRRIAELEAALEPFAKFCEAIDAMETRMGIPRSSDKKKIHDDLFVGDFRRARAALEGKG